MQTVGTRPLTAFHQPAAAASCNAAYASMLAVQLKRKNHAINQCHCGWEKGKLLPLNFGLPENLACQKIFVHLEVKTQFLRDLETKLNVLQF